MSGSLVNLVAKGIQDVHLTGSPEISFFRSSYKRHTNFVQSIVELRPIGNLLSNSTVTLPITRKGDLLSYIYCDTGSATVGTTFGLSNRVIGIRPKIPLPPSSDCIVAVRRSSKSTRFTPLGCTISTC